MLLGFKQQFAPYVEEGSKTHTIRGKRKRPPKVGEICHCYVNPRQKGMRLLGRWVCVKVEDISIMERHGRPVLVYVDGIALQRDECDSLAWRDGFRTKGRKGAFAEMMKFWKGRLPFKGDVIHWRYEPNWKALGRTPKSSRKKDRAR